MSTKNNNGLSESVFSLKSDEYDKHYHDLKSRYSKEKQERLRYALKNQVIDIGCGTGILLTKLLDEAKDVDYVGIDSSDGMLKVSKKNLSQNYPNVFAEFFSNTSAVGDRKFNYVVSLGVIGYQKNHLKFLNQLTELLSLVKNSKIILTCGNGSSIIRKLLDFIQSKRYKNRLMYHHTNSNVLKLWLHDKELRISEKRFLLPILPILPVMYKGNNRIIQMFYMTQFLVVANVNDQ
jgi:2-polyprenyl-3-methyl-5-hydroxy-6-metoxy-1,4-benzoquinol methylase